MKFPAISMKNVGTTFFKKKPSQSIPTYVDEASSKWVKRMEMLSLFVRSVKFNLLETRYTTPVETRPRTNIAAAYSKCCTLPKAIRDTIFTSVQAIPPAQKKM